MCIFRFYYYAYNLCLNGFLSYTVGVCNYKSECTHCVVIHMESECRCQTCLLCSSWAWQRVVLNSLWPLIPAEVYWILDNIILCGSGGDP